MPPHTGSWKAAHAGSVGSVTQSAASAAAAAASSRAVRSAAAARAIASAGAHARAPRAAPSAAEGPPRAPTGGRRRRRRPWVAGGPSKPTAGSRARGDGGAVGWYSGVVRRFWVFVGVGERELGRGCRNEMHVPTRRPQNPRAGGQATVKFALHSFVPPPPPPLRAPRRGEAGTGTIDPPARRRTPGAGLGGGRAAAPPATCSGPRWRRRRQLHAPLTARHPCRGAGPPAPRRPTLQECMAPRAGALASHSGVARGGEG
jgi:hypothetical protein